MSEWPSVTLQELAESGNCEIKTGPFGTALKASEYASNGVPLISTGEIVGGGFKVLTKTPRIGPDTISRLPQFLLCEGDVVFARKGGVERSAYVSSQQAGWFLGSDALRVRVAGPLTGRFLSYHVYSKRVRAWLTQQAGGSTMASLNQAILGRLAVPVPPLEEQERIAGVLGAFDDLIETNRRLIECVLDMTRAVYVAASRRSKSRIRLGERVAVNPEKRFVGGAGQPLRYLDIGAMTDGSIGDPTPMTWHDAPSRARRRAEFGDVLWATVRPNRRAHGLLVREIEDLVVSTGVAVLRSAELPMSLVFAHTDDPRYVDALVGRVDGSAYPAVKPQDFLTVDVPDLDSDDIALFREGLDPLWRAVGELEEEVADLTSQRDELLPLLMSGKVRVRDLEAAGS